MGKILKGKASSAVSEIKTPERNKKKLAKKKIAPSTSDSQQKNVRFNCNSGEKDHVKYVTTPFLSSMKKDKGKVNKLKENIKNKKKLSFDEENTSSPVKKKLSKKRKLDSDENETADNSGVVEEPQDILMEKKSKTEAPKSGETVQNSVTTSDAFQKSHINEDKLTIFVGNLPLTYDHKKIVKLFNKFGPIENARIRCVPVASINVPKKTTAITKKFNPKRNSANAYVVFKSKESVQKAVAENGMVVDGHHLRIDYAVTKKKDNNKSVFIGGLPFDVEDDDLWNAFKDCGEIEGVRIVRDNVIGMGKGFGYVNFKSIASVELALKLNGTEIKNRKINVQRCLNKKKMKKGNERFASFKTKEKNKQAKVAASSKPSLKLGKELPGGGFQGRTAEQKKKKKKSKKSPDTLRRNKIKKVLGSSPKKLKNSKSKAEKSN